MRQNEIEWGRTRQNEAKWNRMRQNDAECTRMKQNETEWDRMRQNELEWIRITQNETEWNRMRHHEPEWNSLSRFGRIWTDLVGFGYCALSFRFFIAFYRWNRGWTAKPSFFHRVSMLESAKPQLFHGCARHLTKLGLSDHRILRVLRVKYKPQKFHRVFSTNKPPTLHSSQIRLKDQRSAVNKENPVPTDWPGTKE